MDHRLKELGYKKIFELMNNVGLLLHPEDHIQTPTLATWRFRYFGKPDVTKFKDYFKSIFGPKATVTNEDNLINFIIPKPNPSKFYLKDALKNPHFDNCPGKFKIAVGESSKRGLVVGDLEKWQHLLIAGSTDSGKTMFIHSIIHSLIKCATPEEVKFILMDFKGNEFPMYENISFLEKPIIYENDEALDVLEWLVDEMRDRMFRLKEAGCRDIQSYNKEHEMHHIVVIIDEYPNLTLRLKEANEHLIDLAQKGRAAGIHLILSVQKPTVKVVDSLIKGNINTRIAFRVPEVVESVVILGHKGAEELIGYGDMILKDNVRTERIQGCFISDEEIEELGNYYRVDDMFIDSNENESVSKQKRVSQDYKDFYRAIKKCIEDGKCNQSFIYSYLRSSKKRADKVIEKAQEEGLISEEKLGHNYEIYITLEEFIEKYEGV